MTSLAEAEGKYGHVVQSAGGQIFGIERTAWCGRQEEKLKIGTPDGFLKLDVVLNQPNIDAGLRRVGARIDRGLYRGAGPRAECARRTSNRRPGRMARLTAGR